MRKVGRWLILCTSVWHVSSLLFPHDSHGLHRVTREGLPLARSVTALSQNRPEANTAVAPESCAETSLRKSHLPPRTKKHKPKYSKKGPEKQKFQEDEEEYFAELASPDSTHCCSTGGSVPHLPESLSTEYHNQRPQRPQQPQNLDKYPCLLLNADYQPMSYLPLSLWNWQEAIKAVFGGKVTVVDVYSDVVIRAATVQVPLPSVIALQEYVAHNHHTPAFTRRNVFLRDEFRCQYCHQHFPKQDLSIDHVHPRAKGGELHWTNAVTSCLRCNGIKGSQSLEFIKKHYNMQLQREPFVPTNFYLASVASRLMLPRKIHPTWEPYLRMQQRPSLGRPLSAADDSRREQWASE